ncbi:MAG: T9SS type A sorting domain-containing protein [Bacteroidota bacterium]|nr:T9SS type A sorting domain-containing protein [Bacteroidota bacterium]
MRLFIGYLSLLILFNSVVSAQAQLVVSDFLISEENVPSTFVQKNVRVFPNSTKGFIAAWEDNRDGIPGFYAQKFDLYHNPIGKNFPVSSNSMFRFINNNWFLSIGHQISAGYWDDQFMIVSGTFHDSIGNMLTSKTLDWAILPWCGTGYLGVDYHSASTLNQFLFLMRNDGRISISKYDSIGNRLYFQEDLLEYPKKAVDATIAASTSGTYLMTWLEIDENYIESGYFGTFYDTNDSIIISEVPLGFPTRSSNEPYFLDRSNLMKTVCLQDTAYLILVANTDSGYVYYRKFNLQGDPLSEVKRHAIPIIGTTDNYLNNFSISNIQNDKFNIILTNSEYRLGNIFLTNHLFTFNTAGNPEDDVLTDSMQSYNLGESFIKISDSTLYIGTGANNDAYLTKLQYFSPIDNVKLNDDEVGSNEVAPFITKVDDNHFFTCWQNEVKYVGQLLDNFGNKVRNPIMLEGKPCEFFSDWSFINTWRKNSVSGFTLYNSDWNVAKRDTIAVCQIFGDAKILTDSSFVILYSKNESDVWLTLYNKNGIEILSREVVSTDQTYGLTIFINDKNSFWIRFGRKVQLFSNSLEPLTIATIANASLHLEGDKFLRVRQEYLYLRPQYYGTIIMSTGDTVKNKFLLTNYASELSYGRLTSRSFIVIYKTGNMIYAKAFSNDGIQERDSVLIHSPNEKSKQQGTYAVHNNKVFFIWSETRTPSHGYSIYGSVFNVSTFVNVQETQENKIPLYFNLEQNYPNPFNPSTTIHFSLPKESHVTLKVYNMLGQEVMTVLNEDKIAGRYDLKINGTLLASGVYFYRLVAGDPLLRSGQVFVSTKKFIFLK